MLYLTHLEQFVLDRPNPELKRNGKNSPKTTVKEENEGPN